MSLNFNTNEHELFLHKEYSFEREVIVDFNENLVQYDKKVFFKVEKDTENDIHTTTINREDGIYGRKRRIYKMNPNLKEISPEEFNRRKWRKDSFMKRIRRIFFKFMKKVCWEKFHFRIKLAKELKSNISIEFNTKILQMTLNDLFNTFLINKNDYNSFCKFNNDFKVFSETQVY